MGLISDSSANINNVILLEQSSAPATPPAGKRRFFAKNDGVYMVDSAGLVTQLLTGGASYTYGAYLLQRTVVGVGGQASIDISSIPATYDRIEIRIQGRVAGATDQLYIAFNNDTTAANYFGAAHYGGTSTGSTEQASRQICDIGSNAGANVGGGTILIDNYANTSLYKSARAISGSLSGAGNNDSYVSEVQLAWLNTAAINRITLTVSNGSNFAQGTLVVVLGWK